MSDVETVVYGVERAGRARQRGDRRVNNTDRRSGGGASYRAIARAGVGYFTSIRRRFDVSPAGFGIVTSSTPSLNDAFTWSSFTPSGSGMFRENEP